jgi:ribosomal-protein-alanine N-acetyltransferase
VRLLQPAPDLIETPRLHLRRPLPGDALQIFSRYASDGAVTRYMSFRCHQSIADTTMFIDFSNVEWAANGCGPYLVVSRESGELLGGTGLSLQEDEAETGYLFARDAWGYGYATESLAAMVDVGRAIGLRGLHAHCHPDNRASSRVLEKCGFTFEHRAKASHVFPNLDSVKQDVLFYLLSFEPRPVPSPLG